MAGDLKREKRREEKRKRRGLTTDFTDDTD
jgi:hypothetical protein